MSEDRKKVLQMLTEGTISVEDAERLLSKLNGSQDAIDPGRELSPEPRQSNGKSPKYLRVVVSSMTGDAVNIRVPLVFVKTGLKLSTMMPKQATAQLAAEGIDLGGLGELKGEELMEALRELDIDIASCEGESIRVFCE